MSFFGDAFREFTGRQSSERISDGGFMSQAFYKRRQGGAGKVYWQTDTIPRWVGLRKSTPLHSLRVGQM